ncbi:MAG TPA: hypothetical protein VM123_17020 [archaeon]|nr:hypothetical protein [archaeon]
MIGILSDKLHTFFSSHLAWPLLYGPWRPEKYLARLCSGKKRTLLGSPLEYRLKEQKALLAALLEHAGQYVPYWRETFNKLGIDPVRIDNPLETLAVLPVLKRRTVQKEFLRLVSEDADCRYPLPNASGGSTGKPVSFLTDRAFRTHVTSTAWAADSAAGWRPGARTVYLWGSDRDTAFGESLTGRLKLFLRNQRFFNTFNISEEELLAAHCMMQARRPRVLVGYASSVHLLARLLAGKGLAPHYPEAGVITSAETLTSPMREEIEKVFGSAKVFDRYGTREAGLVAFECAGHKGLHVNMDELVVELVDDLGRPVGPGRPGRVLVTTLYNRAMPLIRFDLEDLAEWSKDLCSCGDSSPLLAKVLGRSSDTIRTREGKLVHGEFFTHLFYGERAVRRFQFIQESLTRFTLRYEGSASLDEGTRNSLGRKLRTVLGEGVEVNFEHCAEIEPLPSGKYRFTVSLLSGPEAKGESS